jgi:hypothetical protein
MYMPKQACVYRKIKVKKNLYVISNRNLLKSQKRTCEYLWVKCNKIIQTSTGGFTVVIRSTVVSPTEFSGTKIKVLFCRYDTVPLSLNTMSNFFLLSLWLWNKKNTTIASKCILDKFLCKWHWFSISMFLGIYYWREITSEKMDN